MAMIICKECGKEVSDKANNCPNCGCPINLYNLYAQPQETRQFVDEKPKKKKHSALSTWSAILALFGCTTPIAVIFAIVDLCKNEKEKKHGGSIFALIMAALFIFVISITPADTEKEELKEKTEVQTEVQSDNYSENTEENSSEQVLEEESSAEYEKTGSISEKEILFRDLKWGSSYPDIESQLGELTFMPLYGEAYQSPSVEAVLYGDYEGIDFEYTDINIIATSINGTIDVAGYDVEEVSLYFSYIPVDGVLTKEEKDTSFYGARYVIHPQDLEAVKNDLIDKLSSIYGEPLGNANDTDLYDNKYTYTSWAGQNETALVLKTRDATNDTTDLYDNEITISYACNKGDIDLQTASDILKQEDIKKEKSVISNGTSDGL